MGVHGDWAQSSGEFVLTVACALSLGKLGRIGGGCYVYMYPSLSKLHQKLV